MGRRAETIILPLELLRHLKPSEFNDPHDYHLWQRRQLKILEAGLLLYPSIQLDKSNSNAVQLRDIILESEIKPIDTSKNSETMRALCNCVVSLSWRSSNGSSVDSCHWADGFPLNIHLYLSLMHSIFDIKEETLVLDDIDEMLELMKKTWSTLGINKLTHNVCLAWTLFHQYVATSQKEPDLLCATMAMLAEVANDAKRADREVIYFKVLSKALTSMLRWSDKILVDYHESYRKNVSISSMENLLPLALSVAKILDEDISNAGVLQERVDTEDNSPGNKVDYYIRSSLRNEFEKIIENGAQKLSDEVEENAGETFIWLANETDKLTMKEKENFSPILKRWHPIAVGVAAMTLHNCYGTVLKQYLAGVSTLMNDVIKVLERAGKLENLLVQMVVEDSVDCEDGGKAVVREMVPYEVDSIILNLLRSWINEKMSKGEEYLDKAKETETWNPKSKTKPYAQSAVDVVKVAKETVDDFFEIPIGISNDLIHDLADSLEHLFEEYTSLVASCGSKQSYVPTLPPLTRCNRDSRFIKLWKKAAPCKVGADLSPRAGSSNGFHPRSSTSRGTQRLYIRLNTLHYILSELHSIEKMLSLSPRQTSASFLNDSSNCRHLASSTPYFEHVRSFIQSACQQVSEVAAYRLIYLDSNSFFYDGLYVGDVIDARIRSPLRILKQNLTLLAAIVTDKAQPVAVREVMKATFEAFLMVLLAGGNSRIFLKSDHEMIAEDFENLKRVFCSSREGLVAEDIVEKESKMVEGIVGLMGQTTEQLIEDFSIISCKATGLGAANVAQKVPMPPTTGRWSITDPNTILRVLCHRNDSAANRFLKVTFQLPKRR
ncbi:hypothetical protein Syun_006891 [Stephania yunnanensis]|uniref:MHD1 domain-containing protein n=1 Tax=Stephania yunnanensis TaxID=152371 RepID=A0AAP0KYG8_9MAGN